MSRQKRNSPVLQTARERLAGLKKFPAEADFGPALTVTAYETEINGYAADENSYNQDLAALDDKQNRLDARQDGLNDLNQRILAAVKSAVRIRQQRVRTGRRHPSQRAQETYAQTDRRFRHK